MVFQRKSEPEFRKGPLQKKTKNLGPDGVQGEPKMCPGDSKRCPREPKRVPRVLKNDPGSPSFIF